MQRSSNSWQSKLELLKRKKKHQTINVVKVVEGVLIYCCWEWTLAQSLEKHALQKAKVGLTIPFHSYISEGIKSKHKGELRTHI